MNKLIIDEHFLGYYLRKIKDYIPEDKDINIHDLKNVVLRIHMGKPIEALFYSQAMIISIVVFLHFLIADGIIFIDENYKVHFSSSYELRCGQTIKRIDLIDCSCDFDDTEIIEFINQKNISPNTEFYQSYNTNESLRRRLNTIISQNNQSVDSVIFLGDDELFSVYYAYLLNPKRVVMLDIDDSVCAKVEEANVKFNLNIEVFKCDLTKSLPKELIGNFDMFFASGLKDLGGLLIFIYSGVTLLNSSTKSLGYVTFYDYNTNDGKAYQYKLTSKLMENRCYMDLIVPCDQAVITGEYAKGVLNYLRINANKSDINKESLKDFLRENNSFAVDPIYPYFAVKPINLARIQYHGKDKGGINKSLSVLKRFSKRAPVTE